MKKLLALLALLAAFIPDGALAQCNGQFGANQVCGSLAGGFAGPVNFSSFPVSGGGGVGAGAARISFSSYVAFGDSITVGTGAGIPADAYATAIANDAGVPGTFTNAGVSGDSSCDWNNHVFAGYNPGPYFQNMQTVLIGTNDAQLKHAGAYEAVFNQCFSSAIAWLTIPAASGNATYRVFGNSNGVVTTGSWSTDATYPVTFTGASAANVLTVSAVAAGAVQVGELITGTGVTAGSFINAQPANTGSITGGTWNWTPSQSVSSTTMSSALGLQSTTNGSTWAGTLVTYGNPVYLWYRCIDSNGGTFTWNVDGGANHSVNAFTTPAIATGNGATKAVCMDTYTGVAAGSHTINLTVTSATSGSNVVSVMGIGTPANLAFWQEPMLFAGGVIQQANNANPGDTSAYNTDAKNNVATLASQGLPVFFVDTRSYVNSSIGMSDAIHPNDMGHTQLRQAFETVIAFQPQPQPTFTPPLCVGIPNCSGPAAIKGTLGSTTTTSTGAQVRLGNNGSTPSLVLDTGTHVSTIDAFGGWRFVFDNASTPLTLDTTGNMVLGGTITAATSGTYQFGTATTTRFGIGVASAISGLQVQSSLGTTTATGTSNVRIGNNSSTPTVLWDDTHNTYEIDVVNGTGWRFVLNEASVPATLSTTGLLTLGDSIVPTLTTDATHTDRTVCQDTTSHQLFFGSGTAGICLGTSSLAFKHDVRPLDVGLAQIMALEPIRYRYNEGYGDPNKELYGFSAEQGRTALPKLASEKSFDYLGVVPVLVKALQEQQAEIAELKAELSRQRH